MPGTTNRPTTPLSTPAPCRSAPQVAAAIVDVPVTDNQSVEAGAELVRLDDRDYIAQRDQAQANVDNLIAQIASQGAKIDQAEKQVTQAHAALAFAQQEADRYQLLAKQGTATVEQAQQYSSNLLQAKASFAAAQANAVATDKQEAVLKAQLESAQAQLAQAATNLSRTIITAPVAGRVTQLTAAKGAYAAVGQVLMMFVPRDVWITANFKETQLDLMRPGQPVDIEIDAYPDRTFEGHVDSIQAGSGTAFSLLPARERDRQLRQDRAARAGEDRLQQAARRIARSRHVGRSDGQGAMSDQSRSRGWDSSRSAAGDRNPWLVAVIVSIATFMVVLDTAIANVSLRYIAGSLAASVDESTWVVTTYLIANAVVLPASGWLSNVVGRKRFYMICVALFTISSLFCGLAPNLPRADLLSHPAGPWRRRHADQRAGHPRRYFSAATARSGLRAVRRRRDRGADGRPDDRRLDHR